MWLGTGVAGPPMGRKLGVQLCFRELYMMGVFISSRSLYGSEPEGLTGPEQVIIGSWRVTGICRWRPREARTNNLVFYNFYSFFWLLIFIFIFIFFFYFTGWNVFF